MLKLDETNPEFATKEAGAAAKKPLSDITQQGWRSFRGTSGVVQTEYWLLRFI